MKKHKLLKNRIMAIALSAAMIFAHADTYAVLAAAPEFETQDAEDTVGSDGTESSEESGAEDTATGASSAEDTNAGASDTEGADTVVDSGSEDGGESADDVEESEEPELSDKPSTDEPAEDEAEDNTAKVNEEDAEEPEAGIADSIEADSRELSETVNSGKINNITWSVDADGLLLIEGSGDYKNASSFSSFPPWANRNDVKSAIVNASEITSTENMFYKCSSLSSVDLSGLNTNKVTDMSAMFDDCKNLSSLDLDGFDTSNVTDMGSMFYNCNNLSSLNLNGIDTRNVTSMGMMFYGCHNLNSLDISGFDTSNVTNMDFMFYDCYQLSSLDLRGFDTSKVTNMGHMFDGCINLSSLDLRGLDTSKVTSMEAMFLSCRNLSSLDISSFDTSKVTNMSGMFSGCRNLGSLDLNALDTSKVTNMSSVFNGCSNLSSVDLDSLDTGEVTDMSSMFYDCSNLSSVDISGFDTSLVKNMRNMFRNCNSLTDLNLGSLDTSKVTNMSEMFNGCSSLTDLDIRGFNVAKVTSMSYMFSGCMNLRSLNASGLDTSKVTDMSGMFYDCISLTDLNISGLDTSNVVKMNRMFLGCRSLAILDLRSMDMGKVENAADMIQNCHGLISICTPLNLNINVELPISDSSDKWYDEAGDTYTALPTGLDHSIVLYKNGYPDDGTGTMKKVVFISGITMEDKTYDKTPISYTGDLVIKDSLGNTITGVTLTASYTGILADGSKYEQTTQPPSQAGNYTLSFDVLESDGYISNTSYPFSINPIVLTITAPSPLMEVGGTLPDLESLEVSVEGLLDGDKLIAQPKLKYSTDNIPTEWASSYYKVIPYGADAGNNYIIEYVEGTLIIRTVYQGASGDLTWAIDYNYKLTVEGTGDYEAVEMWFDVCVGDLIIGHECILVPEWYKYRFDSAEINVSGITNAKYMLSSHSSSTLKNVDLTNFDTSEVTDMSHMFGGCNNLSSLDISGLDTSKVTDMSSMFSGCSNLGSLDLNGFDTSNVADMSGMFSGCNLSNLDISGLDTSKVTDMSGMFSGCSNLGSLDLNGFDTSKVTDMSNMFSGCNLSNLDISGLDTSKVTDMSGMFSGCSNLGSLDLNGFDTSKVTDMSGMFSNCKSSSLDISGLDTSKVTDMSNMFSNSNLSSLDIRGLNTSNVTNMFRMFYECSSLSSLDVSSFNTSNVLNMRGMFYECGVLGSLDLSNFDTSKVTRMQNMFSGCNGLSSLDISGFDTSNVYDMTGMFKDCSGLSSLDLSSFDTGKVTNMRNMFNGCGVTSLDISGFNTSNVTSMRAMFANCGNLTNLYISGFDTSQVTDMYYMFGECSNLTNLDLGSFDTGQGANISCMFYECSSLTNLDVSGFNTSQVTDMSCMFDGCSSLAALDLRNFNTKKIEIMDAMFHNCSSLTSLDLSSFELNLDGGSIAYKYEFFGGCDNLHYIRTPKICTIEINLPTGASGTDIWYRALDTPCTTIPMELSSSIDLYKNGYPGDGVTKRFVTISGISMNSAVYNGKEVKYFGTPVVMDLDGHKITDATVSWYYTGTLADGNAYAEQEQAPSQVGNYKLVMTAQGKDCEGQMIYSFRISPRTVLISAQSASVELDEALPELTQLPYTVTGLLTGDKLITEPSLKYSDSNITTATVGIYAIIPYGAAVGTNYCIEYKEGTLTVGDPDDDSSFEMHERTGLDLSDLGCTIAPIKAKTYTGAAFEPAVKVTVTENGKNKRLSEGIDYRVQYRNNTDAGTATVIIRGSGIYKGSATADFTINRKPVRKLKVVTGGFFGTLSKEMVESENTPLPVYVYDAGKLLERGTDYTLEYDSEKKGNVTVKVKGLDTGNYTGESKVKIPVYTVADEDADYKITPEIVNLSAYTVTYTGKAVKPGVEVSIKGNAVPKKYYKVKYQNNKNAGTAYVIVTGKGAYKGKAVVAFEITKDSQNLTVNNIKPQTYKGKYIKPSVTVKAGNKKLRKNKDYILTYKNNFHAGEATVTVTGIGGYSGTAKQTFIINSANAAKITVKGVWKDNDGDEIKDSGALLVYYGKRQLKEGVDFTLETDGTITKNKVKVTIKGVEGRDFIGSVTRKVKAE